MLLVPPNRDYIGYIDYKVIAQLFCLMSVTAMFTSCGVLDALSKKITHSCKSVRDVALALCFCCFFTSMLITNDVALLTFVPLTLGIFAPRDKNLITIVVLESISANLGSMATPVGNPQNLFLFSYYNMSIGEFLLAVLPLVALSAVMIFIATLLLIKNTSSDIFSTAAITSADAPRDISPIAVSRAAVLFLLCILTVLGALDWRICLAIVAAAMLIFERGIFKKVDYMLLATFVCFFIFVGNIGSLEPVRNFVSSMLSRGVTIVSALISQVISNVPAAVMLAPFTSSAYELLRGVNIGGLGTLIASLASLIAFKLYAKGEGSAKLRYLLIFTAINLAFLLPLTAFALLFM